MTRHLKVQQSGLAYFISPDAQAPDWLEKIAFDPAELARAGHIQGQASGRAQAWFFSLNDTAMVLRHYQRGGLPAHFSADRYLWLGLTRSRPWRELNLLNCLRALNLPVPLPLGGRVERTQFFYTADIVTEQIPASATLAERITQGWNDWAALGQRLRDFHAVGAGHADLNVRNILIDEQAKIWLIDWDRGHMGAGRQQQKASLKRLRRSLAREPALDAAAQKGWSALERAYQAF